MSSSAIFLCLFHRTALSTYFDVNLLAALHLPDFLALPLWILSPWAEAAKKLQCWHLFSPGTRLLRPRSLPTAVGCVLQYLSMYSSPISSVLYRQCGAGSQVGVQRSPGRTPW